MSIKKYMSLAIGVGALASALLGFSTSALAGPSYIQLGADDDQLVTADQINKPQRAHLTSQDDSMGTALSWDKNEPSVITVNEDGAYFLMTVAQVGSHEGEQYKDYKGADVYIWNTLNGKIVEDSGSWVFASATARAKTIVSSLAIQLKKGDKLGFMYSSSSAQGGLTSKAPTADRPGAGALTVTMYKLN